MKKKNNHEGKPLKYSMVGLFALTITMMLIMTSGVVSAYMPGAPGENTVIETAGADFDVDSNSWSSSMQRNSFYAYACAFGQGDDMACAMGSLYAKGYQTFTITSAGTYYINVDYYVNVYDHTSYSDSDGPGQIFQDMYMDLKNSAGVRVMQDWDNIITHMMNSNQATHYVLSPTHTKSVYLPTGTYTIYVGIITSMNCWAWGEPEYAMAWSWGYWDVDGLSIT